MFLAIQHKWSVAILFYQAFNQTWLLDLINNKYEYWDKWKYPLLYASTRN